VLRTQIGDVVAGLESAGFAAPRIVFRGKWCAGITMMHRRE